MRVPKIIQLLTVLTAKEMERFVDYVASPFYNKRQDLAALARVLRTYHPFTTVVDDHTIHTATFPDEPYGYQSIRRRYSALYDLAVRYLATVHTDNEVAASQRMAHIWGQASALRSRRLHASFQSFVARARAESDTAPVVDDFTYELRWRLSEEVSLYETLVRPAGNRMILQEQLDLILQMTAIRLLRLYTLMQHERHTMDAPFQPYLVHDLVALLETEAHLASAPVIQVYLAVYRLEEQPSDETYQNLVRIFDEHRPRLDYMDAYMAHLHLTGYCTARINLDGDERYFREAWLLMRENIALGFMQEGNLLYPDFIYVVRLAGMSGEEPWARAYMDRFAPALQDDVRDSIVAFGEGFLAMCGERYDEALRAFARSAISSPICNVQLRAYTICCLYHTERYDQALAACDTFRHYLQKETTLTPYYTDSLRAFIRLVPRLITLRNTPGGRQTATRIAAVLKDLDAVPTNVFNLRNWLRRALLGIQPASS